MKKPEELKIYHTTICKNEEHVVGRMIDSVKDVVDGYVMVDTGSEDKTVEVLTNKFKEIGKGTILHKEWTGSYSEARNYGIDNVPKDADWILVMDCDEHMKPESAQNLRKILAETPDHIWEWLCLVWDYYKPNDYAVPGLILFGHRLFRAGKGIYWGGTGHEALKTPFDNRGNNRNITVYHDKTPDAASPIAPKQNELAHAFVEDFMSAIEKNPKDVRSMFYMANSYMGQGKYSEAIKWYKTYLKTSTWDDERYQAALYLARCYKYIGMKDEAVMTMLDAMRFRADRTEGDILLGTIAYERKNLRQARFWFQVACDKALKPWPESLLFLEGPAYTYLPFDWLATVAWELGDKKEAKEATIKALEYVPNDKRLTNNLRFYN